MMTKTTIAIVRDSRQILGDIKTVLEYNNRFVDMDEVVQYLLDNMPEEMKVAIDKLNGKI